MPGNTLAYSGGDYDLNLVNFNKLNPIFNNKHAGTAGASKRAAVFMLQIKLFLNAIKTLSLSDHDMNIIVGRMEK